MTKMSKTAALREARRQVSMYRQGRGWVVSYYDEGVRAWRDSGEYTYEKARARVKGIKATTALELMGYDLMDLPANLINQGAPRDLVRTWIES